MEKSTSIPQIFGENVFGNTVRKKLLPPDIYCALRKTVEEGTPLDVSISDAVAAAMKEWAISKGATHYTHWFQPLTGLTAEKHESFIQPEGDKVILNLTGKNLIVGESDASSFPSGGSRATHMARGYTAWDPTSPAFVMDGTLYIPSVFVSHTGETLDNKSPLLRSMTALDRQAKRILKLFNINCKKVTASVGPEQEYFLIDQQAFSKRKDLILTGRTLFGAPVPRGQELEDNYYGPLNARVSAFMHELDDTLWRFGVASKAKHNEVAPAQHELVSVYSGLNTAVDANMLTMQLMQRIANKHGLALILHEKPFKGINGSGKHNNWSISTDSGFNLLNPGDEPENNLLFKLVLTAIISAVDDYQGLLRAYVSSAGNDHRLGADEAPPAILSVYLGDQLGDMVESIVKGEKFIKKKSLLSSIGVPESPIFPKDVTDRNRTSPFAFTGDKFEFRMVGSTANLAEANICLNTIVADAFEQFANALENCDNFEAQANALIESELKKHYRIIYNLDGYGPEWEAEAAKRGLLNLKDTADAVPVCYEDKNISVFTRQSVFTREEAIARADIRLENYTKIINIEAQTMLEMARRDVIPAVAAFVAELCNGINAKRATGLSYKAEQRIAERLTALNDKASDSCERLARDLAGVDKYDIRAAAKTMAHTVLPDMTDLRKCVDEMEGLTSSKYWPYITYTDILYSVR